MSDGLLRVSEAAALETADLEAEGANTLTIRCSKTDQEAEGAVQYIGGPTVARVRAWLDAAGITTGGRRRFGGGSLSSGQCDLGSLPKAGGCKSGTIEHGSNRNGATGTTCTMRKWTKKNAPGFRVARPRARWPLPPDLPRFRVALEVHPARRSPL